MVIEQLKQSCDGSDLFKDIKARNTADYMIRTAQQHHVQASAMADVKSNIIITASSIVLTVSLSQMSNPLIKESLAILCSFTLVALLLAIFTVVPKKLSPAQVDPKSNPMFNFLFFGHFAHLSLDQYKKEMATILASDTLIYDSLVKDLYSIGIYLHGSKYRYLRYSYIFFLSGFIFTVLHLVCKML